MTAQEFAQRHPHLYHLTDPDALPSIERFGLLSTSALLTLFEVTTAERAAIERRRRSATVSLSHPRYGKVQITDNLPLSEQALGKCLDDNLSPQDWLGMLNERVFFWPSLSTLDVHLNARMNRGRDRRVLVSDTLALARAYGPQMELAAINTGSTIRKPARRGLATFTALHACSRAEWAGLRGRRDTLKEVTLGQGMTDVRPFLLETYLVSERQAP
jgi:hypothetical protein